jgi:hypothetical protein
MQRDIKACRCWISRMRFARRWWAREIPQPPPEASSLRTKSNLSGSARDISSIVRSKSGTHGAHVDADRLRLLQKSPVDDARHEGVLQSPGAIMWNSGRCCARAASGQAAAPPSPAMNSRRRSKIFICPSHAREPYQGKIARLKPVVLTSKRGGLGLQHRKTGFSGPGGAAGPSCYMPEALEVRSREIQKGIIAKAIRVAFAQLCDLDDAQGEHLPRRVLVHIGVKTNPLFSTACRA